MPFYEYECKSCGHHLEAMQKISEAPLKKCPHCGKSQLTRLMSAPVFRLKGGGWYETDFKGEQDHKKNLADRPEADTAKDDKKGAGDVKGADGAESAKPADKTGDKSADKPSEKPAEKAAAPEAAKKPAGNGISRRGSQAASKPESRQAAAKRTTKPSPKPAAKGKLKAKGRR